MNHRYLYLGRFETQDDATYTYELATQLPNTEIQPISPSTYLCACACAEGGEERKKERKRKKEREGESVCVCGSFPFFFISPPVSDSYVREI